MPYVIKDSGDGIIDIIATGIGHTVRILDTGTTLDVYGNLNVRGATTFVGPFTPSGAVNIKDTSTTAFTVANAGGATTYFTVDTSTPLVTIAAPTTIAGTANTAAVVNITDGTLSYYAVDTRTGVTGVTSNTFNNSNPTFASASGSSHTLVGLASYTLTLTGGTGVTALNGVSLDILAATVTTLSSVRIAGPNATGSGPVTATNAFTLDLPTWTANGTVAANIRNTAPTGATSNYAELLTSGGTPGTSAIVVNGTWQGNPGRMIDLNATIQPLGNTEEIYLISGRSTLSTSTFTAIVGRAFLWAPTFSHGSGGAWTTQIGAYFAGSFDTSGDIFQIQATAFTANAGQTAYQLDTGIVTGAATATFGAWRIGGVTGAGTQSALIISGANTSTATTNYGFLIGAVSGAGTLNVGLSIGAVSGSTSNFAIQTGVGLVNLYGASAATAHGSITNAFTFGTSPGVLGVYFGSSTPAISAGKGSLYLRTDGTGVADRAYINTDGGTTWTALTTAG